MGEKVLVQALTAEAVTVLGERYNGRAVSSSLNIQKPLLYSWFLNQLRVKAKGVVLNCMFLKVFLWGVEVRRTSLLFLQA